MSDQEFSIPRPLVLRVEISAEQAASLAPLLGGELVGASQEEHDPISVERPLQPISEYAADARTTSSSASRVTWRMREAEFEADVQFREDRIERWRTELEELEQTLDRRERDLVSYVDQLQGAMSGSDGAWWSRARRRRRRRPISSALRAKASLSLRGWDGASR